MVKEIARFKVKTAVLAVRAKFAAMIIFPVGMEINVVVGVLDKVMHVLDKNRSIARFGLGMISI